MKATVCNCLKCPRNFARTQGRPCFRWTLHSRPSIILNCPEWGILARRNAS